MLKNGMPPRVEGNRLSRLTFLKERRSFMFCLLMITIKNMSIRIRLLLLANLIDMFHFKLWGEVWRFITLPDRLPRIHHGVTRENAKACVCLKKILTGCTDLKYQITNTCSSKYMWNKRVNLKATSVTFFRFQVC